MNTKGKHKTLIGLVAVTVMMSSMSAHAALTAVTQDGNLMVSDSTLNVTWADTSSGRISYSAAQAWVAGLNTEDYGGYNNWTLATGDGTYTQLGGNCAALGFTSNGQGCGSSTSTTLNQQGYLFINELGNTPGSPATNLSPFTTLSTDELYWSSTPATEFPDGCGFFTGYDYQDCGGYGGYLGGASPLAVRPGQVSLSAQLAALVTEVTGVGLGKSVAKMVELAQTYYAANDVPATCAVLTGFVNEVKAQNGKKIATTLDAQLIAEADAIETAIGCN